MTRHNHAPSKASNFYGNKTTAPEAMMSAGSTSDFRCPYCVRDTFVASSKVLLFSHVRLVHSLDSNFNIQCSLDGCSRTFRHLRTYQNHLLTHRDVNFGLPDEEEQEIHSAASCDGLSASVDPQGIEAYYFSTPSHTPLSKDTLQMYTAKWILKTSETRSLTRAATLGIVEDVADLIATLSLSLKEEMKEILRSNEVQQDIVSAAEAVFDGCATKPFEGLTSFHQQLQFYRDHFNMIEPRRIVLKTTSTQRIAGRRRKIVITKKEMMYIPLLETLQSQLNNAKILQEVDSGHCDAKFLSDYCDGQQCSEHPLFSKDITYLQLILYYDELEVCNPLGSRRKKHKIGAFYYMLGNVSPQFRSKTSNIQLLALAKYKIVVEFGIDHILRPIVEDIKKLESENGYPFLINGHVRHFRGTVSIVSADNPASAALGGFKQSASAFRLCRHCMGTEQDIQSQFVESQFKLRSTTEHTHQCNLVEHEALSASDQHHYSVTFGVNRKALLDSLHFFNVASGALVPDIMHDLLEGALPLELKLMLKVFVVDEKMFTLDTIDNLLEGLNLRSFDGDKPSILAGINLTVVDSNLHQHAMQMWTLARFLPFAIGHMIPEGNEYWANFLRLLDIMDIIFSRHIPREECGYLESLISDHHLHLKELYPGVSITLKLHSMVHMPRLILEFGPLINHWTTRFEAKHKYFKHLSNIMGNFTNICYSLALRHQLFRCYVSLNTDSLPGEDIEVGPGKTVEYSGLPIWKSTTLLSTSTLFRANWVCINGTKYQMPFVLIVDKEDEELKFGMVTNIYVDGSTTAYFEFVPAVTKEYCSHFHAYALFIPTASSSSYLINHCHLLDFHPYGLYHSTTVLPEHNVQYTVIRNNVYIA